MGVQKVCRGLSTFVFWKSVKQLSVVEGVGEEDLGLSGSSMLPSSAILKKWLLLLVIRNIYYLSGKPMNWIVSGTLTEIAEY